MPVSSRFVIETWVWVAFALWSCNFRDEKQKGLLPPFEQLDGAAIASDFAYLQSTLFNLSCASCHNTGRSSGNINLTSYEAIRNGLSSAGRPLLIPGQAEASLLYQVLSSGQMPPSGPKASEISIDLLRCWLEEGAAEIGQAAACAEFRSDLDRGEGPLAPLLEGNGIEAEKKQEEVAGEETGEGTATDTETNTDSDTAEPSEEEPKPVVVPIEPVLPAVTFKTVADILFNPYFCGDCHGPESPAGNIDLSSYQSVINAGNSKGAAVVAGKPEDSLLYVAVASGLMPDDGSPMTGQPKVDLEALQALKQWILQGAKL